MTADTPSTRLLAHLRRAADLLNEVRVPWALFGGLAVSIRSEPRFTRDIDLAVAVSDDESAEAVVSAFVVRGFGLRLSLEHHALARLATVRLVPPGEAAATCSGVRRVRQGCEGASALKKLQHASAESLEIRRIHAADGGTLRAPHGRRGPSSRSPPPDDARMRQWSRGSA